MSKNNRSMFIQPMIDYDPDEWVGMAFGVPQEINANSTFMIGFVFKTEGYAKKFLDLLRSYNNDEDVDIDNNIRLSFITEDPETYSVYVYPSPERENVRIYQKEMEEKFGPNHEHLIVQMIICKQFPYGETSTFKKFKEVYKESNPIEIRVFYVKDNQLQEVKGVRPILKTSIKIQHRQLLNKYDMEYQHYKGLRDRH